VTKAACRNCGAADLEVVLDFGDMPLANGLLTAEQLAEPEDRFPLALGVCPNCSLAQITHTVAPERLFREYPYFSSTSDAMVEHARALVETVITGRGLGPRSLAVEVASNDGYLLQHYAARGIPVLGIDPARNVAEVATAKGIPTLPEFFDDGLAATLAASGRTADVVHANNVLAHVPDLHGFVAGIATVLKPTGVAIFETPYVRDLVERLEFDTIYHEHVFYYSLASIADVVGRHGLTVIDVERLAIHGGSIRVTVAHADAVAPAPGVGALLAEEQQAGLATVAFFRGFADRVRALRESLLTTLAEQQVLGRRIAAYGAAAKGAVLLNAFRIGTETLEFVADRSPHKAGRYMPGVRVPVRHADDLLDRRPDVCLLLAWNFAEEILRQQAAYRAAGGRFLLAIPEVRWA
jgi:SAM-dependent methyltransferase